MKLSVMLFPFHSPLINGALDAKTLIGTLQENGAEAVETMVGLEAKAPSIFEELLNAIKEARLPISCNDIGINLIGEHETREARLADAKRYIAESRSILNTDRVLLYNSNITPEMSLEEGRRIYAENLAMLADYADTLGITATIEDFDPTPDLACSAEHCMEILNAAGPKPKLTFDTGNFFEAGEVSTEVFPMVSSRIAHCHIKDVVLTPEGPRRKKSCIIGEGIADIAQCIKLLEGIGYDGYLSVEIAGSKLEDAVTGLKFLKKCLGRA